MAEEVVEKKRKRGSRGGALKKEIVVTVERETESPELIPTIATEPALNESEEPNESGEPKVIKKTRRSKKGKGAVEEHLGYYQDTIGSHSNSIGFVGQQQQNSTVEPKQPYIKEELEEETRSYFQQIEKKLENLENEFEDPEERNMFVSSIHREVKGKEINLCCDFETSRILERLLKCSFDIQARAFAFSLLPNLDVLWKDQFGSHVVQTLLDFAAEVVEREFKGIADGAPADEEPEQVGTMLEYVVELVTRLNGNWNEYIFHSHASHVFRTLLNLLAGQTLVQEGQVRSKKSTVYNINHNTGKKSVKTVRLVPTRFATLLTEIVTSISTNLTDIRTVSLNPIANPVLQLLLSIPASSEILISCLFKDIETTKEFVDTLIKDQVGSHLMEKIIEFGNDAQYKLLYKLLELCYHPISNFCVQAMISHPRKPKQFQEMVEMLVPNFEDFLFGTGNRAGIVVKVVETAIRYPEHQPVIVTGILAAFHAVNEVRQAPLANLILNMRTFESFETRVFVHRPSTSGSLLLQHVVQFTPESCRVFVDSLLVLSKDDLSFWIRDPTASRVLESLLSSTTAPNKSKRGLVELFLGSFTTLAMDKYASHFVDKCWAACNLELKTAIAQELSENFTKLGNNFHGKFILRNCNVELFRSRKDEWLNYQKGLQKEKKAISKKKRDEIDDVFAGFA